MYINPEIKKDIFKTYGASESDTGSPESQIALFTKRINHLTGHLKKNKKDKGTQKALIAMVGKRRRMLDYLKDNEINRYREIIKKLNLRK